MEKSTVTEEELKAEPATAFTEALGLLPRSLAEEVAHHALPGRNFRFRHNFLLHGWIS